MGNRQYMIEVNSRRQLQLQTHGETYHLVAVPE
jgi:hypothetical protein